MKSGLVSLLTGEATISAIVSSRVYINRAPQKATLPYIIITQMAADNHITLNGSSNNFRTLTFDIDCKAKTSLEAATLSDAVRVFIDDYSGTAGTYTIGAVLMNGEADDYEAPADASDVGVYVVTLDVDIQFNP